MTGIVTQTATAYATVPTSPDPIASTTSPLAVCRAGNGSVT